MRRLLQLTILCLFISGGLFAQNRFWVGTPANGDWHDPANWSLTSGGPGGASVPGELPAGAALTAIFDGGSSANADVNSLANLASVQIRNTYTGTITQSDILLISGNMVVSGGTFVGGSTLVVSGTYTQNGGSVTLGNQANTIAGAFSLTGAGTFTTGPGNLTLNGATITVSTPSNFSATVGTVIFDGNASSVINVAGTTRAGLAFNNVTLNKINNVDDALNNLSLPGVDTLVVTGTLNLNNGNFEGGNSVIRAEGNVTVQQNFDGATGGDLIFGGAANQTAVFNRTFGITGNSGIIINKTNPAGTVSFTTGVGTTISLFTNPLAFFTVNSGTVNFPDNDIVEMNVVNFGIAGSGTFISTAATMNLPGNFTNNSASPTAFQHNNGTVAFTGTVNRSFSVRGAGVNASTTFYNVVLNKTNAPGNLLISNGDTLIAANELQLVDGAFAVTAGATAGPGYVRVDGNLSATTNFGGFSSFTHLIFGGAAPSNISLAGAAVSSINGPVTFNKSAGTVITLASPVLFDVPVQQINFIGGIVSSASPNFITFGASAVANGGNNGSYIDGPVRKTGVTAFTFPTGDGGFFAPVRITGNPGFNDPFAGGVKTFEAEYFHTDPDPLYDTESIQDPDPLLKVSNVEYWRVANVGTIIPAQRPYLWLSYEDARSGGLTVPDAVGVAAWLGSSEWSVFGHGGVTTADGVSYIRSGSRNLTTNEINPVFTFITDEPENNPLPVTWLGFTGRYYNGVVELNWSTSLELNNATFTVERSGDGDKYQAIGTIPGRGTVSSTSYYSFTDKEPVPGVNHYRIKQTDIDGKFSYSKEIRVSTAELGTNGLRLFPNPMTATQPLILENADWKNQKATITIFSATGGLVQQEQVTFGADSRSRLNLSRLKKGSYFITTTLADGKKQTLSFIVQ